MNVNDMDIPNLVYVLRNCAASNVCTRVCPLYQTDNCSAHLIRAAADKLEQFHNFFGAQNCWLIEKVNLLEVENQRLKEVENQRLKKDGYS